VRARIAIWALIAFAVVLATRTLVYALAPQSSLVTELADNRAVGPHLAGPLVVILVAAGLLAATALLIAVSAVRVRLQLEGRRLVSRPRLRPAVLAARLLALFLTASFAFAMLESYIHWREGLGWHGLHCLLGPVHRDAIPILAALSLVAVAFHGAIEHLLAWARRLFAQLASRLFVPPGSERAPKAFSCPPRARALVANGARGPPSLAVPVS
jgi:hypothetical protein